MKTDILIIGGSAGGMLTATTAKKIHKDKSVTIIRKTDKVMVPCGIPYIFGTLHDSKKNRVKDEPFLNMGIKIINDEVISINHLNNTVSLNDGEDVEYEKLVIATGSLPIEGSFIKGYKLRNVYPILKDEYYLQYMYEAINEIEEVVVIGGGFIGVEFAEQLAENGKKVTLVEAAPKILATAFDDEVCDLSEKLMTEKGIKIITNTKVLEIIGGGSVEGVKLDNGETISAKAVVLGMGVKPNSGLAKSAGVDINNIDSIIVDEYMRTNLKDIFAVGDCAEKKCFFTGKNVPILLASTAAMEAKIAASNLYGLRYVRQNKGTISAFATSIYEKAFAVAGITEKRAIEEGFEIVIGNAKTFDKHPGSLPSSSMLEVKLIFVKTSGVLIGAQVIGGITSAEMINILSLAIQKGMTANELNTFQVATHPLLTSSPTAYPINSASLDALSKMI